MNVSDDTNLSLEDDIVVKQTSSNLSSHLDNFNYDQNKNLSKTFKNSLKNYLNNEHPDDCQIVQNVPPEAPKLLIQRVFQQSEKHTVQTKLDFVIANSETEITKHVFGGLFNTKYYPYLPENYCKKHAPDLFQYENKELPKIGDKFDCYNSFRLYIDGKAKEWKYYLKCADSHRKNGEDTFVYKCVFAKPRSAISKAKGLRKRTRRVPLHDCPCRVLLKPVPSAAKDLTVIYVCNHHDHPLTDDYFYKLQHGRRLHPSDKEELMDLLSLDVDKEVVRKYFETLTGYTMSYGYFANTLMYMKRKKIERQFSLEKLKEMSKKIDKIKEDLGLTNENEYEDNPDDDLSQTQSVATGVPSKISEVFNVLSSVTAPKKTPSKRNRNRLDKRKDSHTKLKRTKSRKRDIENLIEAPVGNVTNKSRLETRLQQLKNDEKTLENIKHLQDSVRTEKNPWVDDHSTIGKSKRGCLAGKVNHHDSLDRNMNVNVYSVEDVIKESVMETPVNNIETECNDEIFCECEVTIDENNKENELEYYTIAYEIIESEVDSQNDETVENESYCIQYDTNGDLNEIPDGPYIAFENLENMPLQVQATELATVKISLEENQDNTYDNIVEENEPVNHPDNEVVVEQKLEDLIQVIEQPSVDSSLDLGKRNIYEVIKTNNKKIFPSRDLVHSILNKPKLSSTDKYQEKKIGNKSKSRLTANKGVSKSFFFSKRTPKRISFEFYGDIYSSEDDTKCENEQLMSHLGVDLNHLKDDDYYVIVVDDNHNLKEEGEIS